MCVDKNGAIPGVNKRNEESQESRVENGYGVLTEENIFAYPYVRSLDYERDWLRYKLLPECLTRDQ